MERTATEKVTVRRVVKYENNWYLLECGHWARVVDEILVSPWPEGSKHEWSAYCQIC